MHPCHFALNCCHIYHGDRCPYQKQQYVMQTAAPQYYRESCSSLLRHFDAQLLLDSESPELLMPFSAFQCLHPPFASVSSVKMPASLASYPGAWVRGYASHG